MEQQQQPGHLLADVRANPVIPDDQSRLQPHGEAIKRGPDAPEYNPNAVRGRPVAWQGTMRIGPAFGGTRGLHSG